MFESIFGALFGEPEELPLREQLRNLLWGISAAAQLQANLPVEDLLGVDILFPAHPGAKRVELKGTDVDEDGNVFEVDLQFDTTNKIILKDPDGDSWLFVWGISPLGARFQAAAYWYTYLPEVYNRNKPDKKPPNHAYSINLN